MGRGCLEGAATDTYSTQRENNNAILFYDASTRYLHSQAAAYAQLQVVVWQQAVDSNTRRNAQAASTSQRQVDYSQTRQSVGSPELSYVQYQFIAGYRAAGGSEELFNHIVSHMISCESGWQIYIVSPYGDSGLGQFKVGTWNGVAASTGHTDIWNPYDQGFNVATLSKDGLGPWPSCGLYDYLHG